MVGKDADPPFEACMGDALAASTGRSGGARGRFPGAARAQAAPLHEPERRQAPPFGGMSGGRAFQIGPAHEGGGPRVAGCRSFGVPLAC